MNDLLNEFCISKNNTVAWENLLHRLYDFDTQTLLWVLKHLDTTYDAYDVIGMEILLRTDDGYLVLEDMLQETLANDSLDNIFYPTTLQDERAMLEKCYNLES